MLVLMFLLVISQIALATWAILTYNRLKNEALQFFTPESESKPSHFAASIDAVSIILARAVAAQVKTTLMGLSSGAVRTEKAAQADMAEAGIAQMIPGLGRTLKRNPGLLDLALGFLSRGQPAQASPVDQGNSVTRPKFNL